MTQAALPPYNKPHLNIDQQVKQLQDRGLTIANTQKAKDFLSRIGYYRLSGYWHPFRQFENNRHLDSFLPDCHFSTIIDLYVFDKKLRLLFFDALERIEIALRFSIGYNLGRLDPYFYTKPLLLKPHFITSKNNLRPSDYQTWLSKLDNAYALSKDDFTLHFKQTYSGKMPIWISTELWDFGLLSYFISGLKLNEGILIAKDYKIERHEILISWIRTLNFIRNICAHHGRLWNKPLIDAPKLPVLNTIPLLDHMHKPEFMASDNKRLYSAAVITQYLMRVINPESTWGSRLTDHVKTFPQNPYIKIEHMGFPQGWHTQTIWQP